MSRRGLLGLVGAGAAGVAIGAGAGVAGGIAIARAADGGAATFAVRLLRCAPGGNHDAGAGSHAFRRVRHDGAHGSRRLIALLQDWSYAAARMTRGLEVSATGAVGGSPEAPPDDTGEALGLRRERSHDHVRLRPDPVRHRRRGPLRHRRATSGRSRAAARIPRRRPRSRRVRRRPVHPSLCRRPAGRGARDPQPEPHRVRAGEDPVVADGLRAHVAHDLGAGRRRATSSASRTARRTSWPMTAKRSTSTCGCRHPTHPTGWQAARTSSRARSRC